MRSKEVILNEIKITLESKHDQISGVLIPLKYIDCLKLEYICSNEKTTIQEVISKVIDKKIKQFDFILETENDSKRI